jgi:hypothetical protein
MLQGIVVKPVYTSEDLKQLGPVGDEVGSGNFPAPYLSREFLQQQVTALKCKV